MKVPRIVLASNNRGKLAELQAMLAPLGIELVRQADLGIGEAEEPHRTFIENALAKALLEQMRGVQDRRAALVSTLVAVRSPQDPEPLIAVGRAVGEIAPEPVGEHGFGFDPVMFIPSFGKTFAQLPPEVKNANSHRGQAARRMVELMRERWL